VHPQIPACIIVSHGTDESIARSLMSEPRSIPDADRLTAEEAAGFRERLIRGGALEERMPTGDYRNASFLDDEGNEVNRSMVQEGMDALEKGFSFWAAPSKAASSKHEFTARMPRLVPRFPKISSVSSKLTSFKKKYRSHQVLSRTPKMPKAVGGKIGNNKSSRPEPVKFKAPSFKMPKPVKAKAPSFKMPKPAKAPKFHAFHRSLALDDAGTKFEVFHI
jgi:hypothetical protein